MSVISSRIVIDAIHKSEVDIKAAHEEFDAVIRELEKERAKNTHDAKRALEKRAAEKLPNDIQNGNL